MAEEKFTKFHTEIQNPQISKPMSKMTFLCNLDGYRVKFELPSFFGRIFIFEMNGSDDSCLKYYDIAHFTFVIQKMKWIFFKE